MKFTNYLSFHCRFTQFRRCRFGFGASFSRSSEAKAALAPSVGGNRGPVAPWPGAEVEGKTFSELMAKLHRSQTTGNLWPISCEFMSRLISIDLF